MQLTYRLQAEEHEQFSESAFGSWIGRIIPVDYKETEDGPAIASMGLARLVSTAVLEDGRVAELTLELLDVDNDITVEVLSRTTNEMSFQVSN